MPVEAERDLRVHLVVRLKTLTWQRSCCKMMLIRAMLLFLLEVRLKLARDGAIVWLQASWG